jgi:hypothetical protein
MKHVLFYLVTICAIGCSMKRNLETENTVSEIRDLPISFYQKYAYPLSRGFGFYISEEAEPGEGINSISFNPDYVFLSDGLLRNIKRIDVNTGEVLVGTNLDYSPIDVQVCDTTVFVLTRDTVLFLMDLKLERRKELSIASGEKYFVWSEASSLGVYYPSEKKVQNLDCSTFNLGHPETSQPKQVTGLGKSRGADYSIVNEGSNQFVITKYGRIRLRSAYDEVYRLYNAINIAFDDSMLVHYSINRDRFFLEIYKY